MNGNGGRDESEANQFQTGRIFHAVEFHAEGLTRARINGYLELARRAIRSATECETSWRTRVKTSSGALSLPPLHGERLREGERESLQSESLPCIFAPRETRAGTHQDMHIHADDGAPEDSHGRWCNSQEGSGAERLSGEVAW